MYKKTKQILEELNKGVYEKHEVIALAFLSAMAGESIFLLGPPGVAKSLIARRLKFAFEGGKSFEYLMNRFSTPDEIFGPISIQKLKNDDTYQRVTENYLPNANIVFLDEIWKAGPSIQNALLTVLNEKIYRNGHEEIKLPLRGLISASNELPEKGQGLEALWDRFLVRCLVENVKETQNFHNMILGNTKSNEDNIDTEQKITEKEYQDASSAIDAINVPSEVLKTIDVIRVYLHTMPQEDAIYVSDRRWKKIIHILRASAYLNGRQAVDLMDCFLISHCIWDTPQQIEKVQEIIAKAISEHGFSLELNSVGLKKEIDELNKEVEKEAMEMYVATEKKVANGKFYNVLNFFTGNSLIKIEEFNTLNTQNEKVIGFYDKKLQKVDSYASKKINSEKNQISIKYDNYRGGYTEYSIETHEVNKYRKKKEPVHKALIEHWNKEGKSIKQKIDTEIQTSKDYLNKHKQALENNLFVDKELSKHIIGNITQAIQDLENLKIEVDKIKHLYETTE